MAHEKIFVHPPLDLATDQIRLLSILPNTPDEPIRCTLQTYDIADGQEYVALSYTWGPESPQQQIEINGSEFSIRQNLFDFLVVACKQHMGKLFWIDQICINQSNTSERNHQVMRMGGIYKDASDVYAWLGAESDNSDEAMDSIEALGRKSPQLDLDFFLALIRIDAMKSLLHRPYWSRLWIVQEVTLARRLTILCGLRQLPWEPFIRLMSFPNSFIFTRNAGASKYITFLISVGREDYRIPQFADINDPSPISMLTAVHPENGWDAETIAVAKFRLKVYTCCSFQCADPRDKIWGLAGLYPDDSKRIEVDYDKTVSEVFWDFFTSHLVGIDHVLYGHPWGGDGDPFFTSYVVGDWWRYVNRLMFHMGLDSYSLRVRVAEVLEKTFEELQATWLARGSLDPEYRVDIPTYFADILRVEARKSLSVVTSKQLPE